MRGIGMFTPARMVLPSAGIGDLLAGGYPLPANPVGVVTALPDLTASDLNQDKGMCGCGCASCGGMGEFSLDALGDFIPGETFGIKNGYLAIGLVAALVISGSKRGR